jgi:hypothetical protein
LLENADRRGSDGGDRQGTTPEAHFGLGLQAGWAEAIEK